MASGNGRRQTMFALSHTKCRVRRALFAAKPELKWSIVLGDSSRIMSKSIRRPVSEVLHCEPCSGRRSMSTGIATATCGLPQVLSVPGRWQSSSRPSEQAPDDLGKIDAFLFRTLHIKVQGCKTHTSTFCHRSLFLGDGKVHKGHVGKARLIWGNGCISVPHLFIKVQGCKTHTSTICMVQKIWANTWKTDKFMLAPACCKRSVHQGSILQNPHFNLLHRIQLVHLLSLPAMSANRHLLISNACVQTKGRF